MLKILKGNLHLFAHSEALIQRKVAESRSFYTETVEKQGRKIDFPPRDDENDQTGRDEFDHLRDGTKISSRCDLYITNLHQSSKILQPTSGF